LATTTPEKRTSNTAEEKGAPRTKKTVGDPPQGEGDKEASVTNDVLTEKRQDHDISTSSGSGKSSSLSFGSDVNFLSEMYTIVDVEVKKMDH
jgi:hypothetical protein